MAGKVWLITGVSSGFGRELAKAALARGDTVAGTLRSETQLADFRALAGASSRVPARCHGPGGDSAGRARGY